MIKGIRTKYGESILEWEDLEKYVKDLEYRIDKAIEYIKENANYDIQEESCIDDLYYRECNELLEILGGKEND